MSDHVAPLPQGAGYAVVVGLGFVFAVGMVGTTYALKRYNKEIMTAEEFATAGRSVKTGLIASAVVSSWTWSATLLTSTAQVFKNGIAGSIFYGAGATAQITLFACLAIKARERAPAAHTYLEIVKGRYGTITHCVYIFWGFCTNILVTVMLLAGGSATVNDLTGMHPVAACLLLPLGVVIYTLFGGIKATFLTDYAHTAVLIIIIMIFGFVTWATSDKLGSPGAVWDLVTAYAEANPREGNSHGSYLTMRSHSGGIFFVINIIGNFGTVFLDNGYFNKAFAADPVSSYKGYILGSLAWLPVPAFTSLTMGLSALALEHTEYWPFGRPMTDAEVNSGLVLPNAASALLGQGGAVLALLMVFMAVTSAMSAELIAVSTISTYDIYRTYVNPNATGKKLIWYSHISVIIFAYAMAGFAIGLYYAGVSMGYLYEMMGVIIGGAVLSSALTILSKKQNWHAATFTPIISTALAIMSWLVCTKKQEGSVTYLNTFMDDPMLTGNCVALLSPLVIIPILTFAFKPQNFDWKLLDLRITRVDEDEELAEALGEVEDPENLSPVKSQISVIASQLVESERENYAQERATLKKAFKLCVIVCVTITICLLVLFPMPMYGTGYVFSKPFFTGWVAVFFIWLWYSAFQVIVFPIYEGRHELYHTFRGIYWDLTGQTYKLRAWQNEHPEEMHAVKSQLQAQLSGTAISHDVVDGKALGDGYTSPVNIDDALDDEKK
ncbi:Urea active transporter [Candida viswanathii]|uniref:Urea active transporter n=1 Tax=Candida viswanathii TaxID=5486 RepID=A0A367XRV7_9ASCO|nr:Urea active transporter [Candida viswanathii]